MEFSPRAREISVGLIAAFCLWLCGQTVVPAQPPAPSVGRRLVSILFAVDSATFPAVGRRPIDRAELTAAYAAKPLAASEMERCTRVVRDELRKFPEAVLERYLDRVYLLQEVTFQGVPVGGLNFRQSRTICIDAGPGATDSAITRMLDHEMTHLLVSGRAAGFPYRDWARLNPPGFRYGNGGLEAMRAGILLGDGDDGCRAQGFSRPYGMADESEDIACIGEMLFSGDPTFWSYVDRFRELRTKVEMLAQFFHSLDNVYEINLFRLLPASPFVAGSSRFEPGELVDFPAGGRILTPSDPLRTITIPAGAAALFPSRSGVRLDTRATSLDPEPEWNEADDPAPSIPLGCLLTRGHVGGWLIYAQGRGLVKSRGGDRLVYRDGDPIYFPFGGSIWKPGAETGFSVAADRISAYPSGAVVVINPRPARH